MPKATHRVPREEVEKLTDIVNIGPSIAGDFVRIGVNCPQDLIGRDPWKLYQKLVTQTKTFHDPCVLDTFIAAVDFMNGNPPQTWWSYTQLRKESYTEQIDRLRKYGR